MDRRKTAAALALFGLCGHAFFLPISIAGMQIALAVAAVGVLLDPPRPLRTPLDVPAAAFVAVALVSDLISPFGAPDPAFATLWRSLLGFFVVFHALRVAAARALPRAVGCMLAGLAAASVVGLVQYRTGLDLVHALGLRARPAMVAAPGVPGRYGAMGFFLSRLTFGHNATLLLAFAGGAIASRALGQKATWSAAGVCALALAAIAVTFDRAAYLALAVAAVVVAARTARARVSLALCAVALLALLHPGVRARLSTAFSAGANADRVFIWARAREIIRDHPWRGIGFGNYPRVCGAYYDRVDPRFFMRTWAHNLELSTLAETGPLGLLALAWLVYTAFRAVLRATGPWATGALAALCAWLMIAQFHDLLYDTKVMYALWFSLAAATSPGPLPARAG